MGLTAKGVTGYNVKTKKKDQLMKDVTIKCSNNRYIAVGVDAKTGDKMSAVMGKATAEEAIKKGFAEQGEGWS